MQNVETQPVNTGTTTENRVRKEESFGEVTLSRIYAANFQKEGTLTAELKQTVSTKAYYPTKSVANDLQENLFGTAEFGFTEQEFSNDETRVAWISVPEKMPEADVIARVKASTEARLMKILSNKPILSSDQKYAVDANITTMDVIANSQVIRYPENYAEKPELAGKLILDPNGKVQYRGVYFRTTKVADQDLRTANPADFYASAEIKVELMGATHVVQEGIIPDEPDEKL